jgi:hypothetical protein
MSHQDSTDAAKGTNMNQQINEIEVNGVKYVRADQAAATAPSGIRAVIVVDRGWIFAGDVTQENGRIKLSRAVWVLRWESIGFDGMVRDPKSSKVQIRPVENGVDIPADAEVFRVPVVDNWGL